MVEQNDSGTGYLCRILKHSENPDGQRIATLHLRFPRFILAQFNKHRAFSNSAMSMRAVPTSVLIERVRKDPFIPIWTKNQKGMQGNPPSEEEIQELNQWWVSQANRTADEVSSLLESVKPHKQNINRLLEPFLWVDVVVTATDWDNFLGLRAHDAAQDEIEIVAKSVAVTLAFNEPDKAQWNEWHVPYDDNVNWSDFYDAWSDSYTECLLKISAARCARVSYAPHGSGGKIDCYADCRLAEELLSQGHMVPFEHQAIAVKGRHANFTGWKSYRDHMEKKYWSFHWNRETITQWKQELTGKVQGI